MTACARASGRCPRATRAGESGGEACSELRLPAARARPSEGSAHDDSSWTLSRDFNPEKGQVAEARVSRSSGGRSLAPGRAAALSPASRDDGASVCPAFPPVPVR